MSFFTCAQSFIRERRGGISVEFALVAPLFLLILALSLEGARVQIAAMLLERSAYDIAHQAKVARGENFEMIVQRVLEERNHHLFQPQDVQVTAQWAQDLVVLSEGNGTAGAGGQGDFVMLRLEAKLGLFSFLVGEDKATSLERVITICYVNEPDWRVGTE